MTWIQSRFLSTMSLHLFFPFHCNVLSDFTLFFSLYTSDEAPEVFSFPFSPPSPSHSFLQLHLFQYTHTKKIKRKKNYKRENYNAEKQKKKEVENEKNERIKKGVYIQTFFFTLFHSLSSLSQDSAVIKLKWLNGDKWLVALFILMGAREEREGRERQRKKKKKKLSRNNLRSKREYYDIV